MTTTNQNVRIYRGNTVRLAVDLKMADGTAFDPSLNAELRWRLSRTAHSTEAQALAHKSLGDGIEIIEGGVEIALDVEDTDRPPGIYYHELRVWDTLSEDVSTAMTGNIIIRPVPRMGDTIEPEVGAISLVASAPVREP